MDSSDLYEAHFSWPHPEPTTVLVTGTFDQWSKSIPLTKTATGFEGSIRVPWGETIKFKFIVDGQWVVHEDQPTEIEPGGYVNNFFTAPSKPAPSTVEAPPAQVVDSTPKDAEPSSSAPNGTKDLSAKVDESIQKLQATATDSAAAAASAAASVVSKVSDPGSSEQRAEAAPTSTIPQMFSDFASTVAATDGTSSAFTYVASGLGAAVHSVIGVDPINMDKIAIPTPNPTPQVDAEFDIPAGENVEEPQENAAEPDTPKAEQSPLPVASDVPITIVQVNAAENNTVEPPAVPKEEAIVAAAPDVLDPAVSPEEPTVDALPTPEEPSTHIVLPEAAVAPIVGNLSSTAEDIAAPATKVEEEISAPAPPVPVAEEPAPEVKAEKTTVPAPVDAALEVPAPEEATAEVPEAKEVPAVVLLAVKEHAVSEAKVEETAAPEPTSEPAATAPAEKEVPTPVVTAEEPAAPEEKAEDATASESAPPVVEAVQKEEIAAPALVVVAEEPAVPEVKTEPTPVPEPAAEPAQAAAPEPAEVKEETRAPVAAAKEPAPVAAEPAATEVKEEIPVTTPVVEPTTSEVKKEDAVVAAPAPVAAESPAPEAPKVTTPPAEAKKASTNGHASPAEEKKAESTSTPTASAPSTPAKKPFPSSDSTTPSPSSSRFGTGSTRKKRQSIFGKVKNLFHHDSKDKEKK